MKFICYKVVLNSKYKRSFFYYLLPIKWDKGESLLS